MATRRTTRARQDYLKALYALGGSGGIVPTSRLAEDGLVVLASGRGARLSAAGRRVALDLVRRHRILESFLVRVLGLDWSEVHADAEILEHHVSDRVLEAMDRLAGHPREDPHGHQIPDARGRFKRRPLLPLSALPKGAAAVVREIRDADRRRMSRWKQIGLVPGAPVVVREVRPLDDVFELEVGGKTLVSGGAGLEGILVQLTRRGSHAPAR